jgi:5-methylcytosine-specific restriction endonuclease McrA
VSTLVNEVLRRASSVEELLALLADLSGRSQDALREEVAAHLAGRVAFLLLGEVLGAANYSAIEARVGRRFRDDDIASLATELAQTAAWIETSSVGRKVSIRDLPYPLRQRVLAGQGNRCAVCGWCFADDTPAWRVVEECKATLDHKTPFRLGGDCLENLWILCGLCNLLKESRTHVGEHGRVWINNHVYYEGQRPVAFWTLRRDLRCTECGRGPDSVRLRVRRRLESGAWVVDNCLTLCTQHPDVGGAFDF